MDASSIISFSILIGIPLAGIFAFLAIAKKMQKEQPSQSPYWEMLIIIGSYTGLILLIAMSMANLWSALASMGTILIMGGGFLALLILGLMSYKKRASSLYHRWVFQLSSGFCLICPVVLFAFMVMG